MDTTEGTTGLEATTFDGFISYSHAADGLLAPRLQSGLQRFAKPWWKRRALRVFRDESSLSANPHLWSSITGALDSSGWFVLLLSPDAAASLWVNQEIEYWKTHKNPGRILPVLTDGTFEWSDGDISGSAVPGSLRGVFGEEPRWVDLRFAQDEDQLDLKDPRFADAVADIASALGGVPKDELASEEVKQHRRTVRTAWGAAALVGVLAITAVVFGIQSANNATRAETEAERAETEAQRANQAAERAELEAENARQAQSLARSRELAASAVNVLDEDPELSILLALEAIDEAPPDEEIPVEANKALRQALNTSRLTETIATGFDGPVYLDLSGSGDRLVVAGGEPAGVRMFDTATFETVWSYEPSVDELRTTFPVLSPDGALVAVPMRGRNGHVLILDAADGAVVAEIPYPDCPTINVPRTAWYADGSTLVVSTDGPCARADSVSDFWIDFVDTTSWRSSGLIATEVIPVPHLSNAGVMAVEEIGLSSVEQGGPVTLYDMAALEEIGETSLGSGTISEDATLLSGQEFGVTGIQVLERESRDRLDLLVGEGAQLREGLSFSSDNRFLIQSTAGSYVEIWDLTTGEKAFSLNRGPGTATVDYDPGRETIYTAQSDGTVKSWDLSASIVGAESPSALFPNAWVNADGFKVGPHLGVASVIDLNDFQWYPAFFDAKTGELLTEGEKIREGITGAGWHALPDDRFVLDVFDTAKGEQGPTVVYDPATTTTKEILGCRWLVEESDDESRPCLDKEFSIPPADALGTVYGHLVLSMDRSQLAVIGGYTNEGAGWTIWDTTEMETVHGPAPSDHEGITVTFTDEWVMTFTETHIQAIERKTGDVIWQSSSSRFPQQVTENGAEFESMLEIDRSLELVALVDLEGAVHVVDTTTWSTTVLERDFAQIRGMAFHPNREQLALFLEGRIEVVDLETGISLHTVPIQLPTDGHWLDDDQMVVGTGSGIWTIITFSTEGLVEIARARQPRSFTSNECVLYEIDPCPVGDG
ncbi:hypothetical protein BH23ACT4_BH23ACT4_04250 [soil metagenome]